ncbi:hypothetical protein BKA82DRAFT_4121858 [Pisolithus tinctorius]|nr:hypothetical protein BKA82DRAFT_4121858 [Pisolithus tinctorius]
MVVGVPPTVTLTIFRSIRAWNSALVRSEWFVRGWTLRELIEPGHLQFPHSKLETLLRRGLSSMCLSITQIMSWATNRVAGTRVEDRAYFLMGLFGVLVHHWPICRLIELFRSLE